MLNLPGLYMVSFQDISLGRLFSIESSFSVSIPPPQSLANRIGPRLAQTFASWVGSCLQSRWGYNKVTYWYPSTQRGVCVFVLAYGRTDTGQETDGSMAEDLLQNLRHALNHLYNPDVLSANPLVALLGLSRRWNPGLALQQAIIHAIESMEPSDSLPDYSQISRGHEVLLHRYVQQWSQKEVAELMGISERQVRREQQAALMLLARQLAISYPIEANLAAQHDSAKKASQAVAVDRELRWLHGAPAPEVPTSLPQVLQSALSMTSALVRQHDIRLTMDIASSLPDLSVHPVALRQVLLTLLGFVICRHPGGDLRMSARVTNGDVELLLHAPGLVIGEELNEPVSDLAVIHQLIRVVGGQLSVTQDEAFSATLLFPAAAQVPVLVVDDNRDTLRLFERHVMGTRYCVLATDAPEEALALAMEVVPAIVVLDVMMPDLDGLELLTRFTQHPATDEIPIVVCTILPNADLAIALGASAFLQKPFTREDLLKTLDDLAPSRALAPH
jgi:CheY-like chemotaxis protein